MLKSTLLSVNLLPLDGCTNSQCLKLQKTKKGSTLSCKYWMSSINQRMLRPLFFAGIKDSHHDKKNNNITFYYVLLTILFYFLPIVFLYFSLISCSCNFNHFSGLFNASSKINPGEPNPSTSSRSISPGLGRWK